MPKFHDLSSGSGLLEFSEFCQLASWCLKEDDEETLLEELKEAFRIYDKAEEGWVEVEIMNNIYDDVQFYLHQLSERDSEGARQFPVRGGAGGYY